MRSQFEILCDLIRERKYQQVLDEYTEYDIFKSYGNTSLMTYFAIQNDLEAIEFFLSIGANINGAMQGAGIANNFELIESLLIKGADINVALRYAAAEGHENLVYKLIENGGYPNIAIAGAARGNKDWLLMKLFDNYETSLGSLSFAISAAKTNSQLSKRLDSVYPLMVRKKYSYKESNIILDLEEDLKLEQREIIRRMNSLIEDHGLTSLEALFYLQMDMAPLLISKEPFFALFYQTGLSRDIILEILNKLINVKINVIDKIIKAAEERVKLNLKTNEFKCTFFKINNSDIPNHENDIEQTEASRYFI